MSLDLGKEKEMLVYAIPRYFDYQEGRDIIVKIFEHYPLHAAEALAKIGNPEDLVFLEEQLALYKGPGRASIKQSMKKLAKRLAKKSAL